MESDLVTPVAVLFSGGLDSMILAALTDEYIDPNCKHLLLILTPIRSVSTSLLQNGMMSTLFCPTLLYLQCKAIWYSLQFAETFHFHCLHYTKICILKIEPKANLVPCPREKVHVEQCTSYLILCRTC